MTYLLPRSILYTAIVFFFFFPELYFFFSTVVKMKHCNGMLKI